MQLNLTIDPSSQTVPTGATAALNLVAQFLSAMIADPITVNIEIGFGEYPGDHSAVSAWSAEGGPGKGVAVTYAQLKSALASHAASADDATALASLGSTDTTSGALIYLSGAQAKALGFAASAGAYDGYVGFGAGATQWNFNASNRAGGGWDFFGVALHEVTHALGRIAFLNGSGSGKQDSLLDLFRYTAAGVRDLTGATGSYFSLNGGVTNLSTFSTSSDLGDWSSTVSNDSSDAYTSTGVANQFSAMDARAMDALGFTLASFTVASAASAHAASIPDFWMPIADTAANISAGLATLESMTATSALAPTGSIASLRVTDGGPLTLTQSQIATYGNLLADISNAFSLQIAAASTFSYTLATMDASVLLSGHGGTLVGNALSNTLIGVGAGDTLIGGAGDDTLIGAGAFNLNTAQQQVYRLYATCINRTPDAGGFNYWVNQITSGVSLSTVTVSFVNSLEFQKTYGGLTNSQFVTQLYSNALHRAADAAGLSYWVATLNGGASRQSVVDGFSESAECAALTATAQKGFNRTAIYGASETSAFCLYEAVLGGAPDPASFQNLVGALTSGNSLAGVTAGLTGSAAFQQTYGGLTNTQFVSLLYQNVLHRAPDAGGLSTWTNALNGGASRNSIIDAVAGSAEYFGLEASAFDAFMQTSAAGAADTLSGGIGANTLIGGTSTTAYQFDATVAGTDQVFGFETWDTLRFSNFGYSSAASATSHMSQSGVDVIFQDKGEAITFRGTTLANVSSAHYIVS